MPWSNDWPSEVLGALLLLAAARYAAIAFARARGADGAAFWLAAAAGLVWLALDEAVSLHERAAVALTRIGVPTPTGVNHLDDVIVVAYGLVACAFAARYGPYLKRQPDAVRAPLGAASVALVAAIAIEAKAPVAGWAPVLEELFELTGAALLVVALRARAVRPWPPRLAREVPQPTRAYARPTTRGRGAPGDDAPAR